jgi:acetyl esterase/lipase
MSAALVPVVLVSLLSAQETITLNPRARPGEGPTEKVDDRGQDGAHDRSVSDVRQPELTVYLPPADKATGQGIVVAPGGGYERVVIDKEGHEIARWLTSVGVAAFVLKYRLPPRGETPPTASLKEVVAAKRVAVDDALEAMRVVREGAKRFHINRDAVGMMGFSAGGHLSALVGMTAPRATRPSFLVLVYPGMPPALEVDASTPPTFLVHAADDERVPVADTSIRFFTALRKAKVPAELHVYTTGGHGFALRRKGDTVSTWPAALQAWLARLAKMS